MLWIFVKIVIHYLLSCSIEKKRSYNGELYDRTENEKPHGSTTENIYFFTLTLKIEKKVCEKFEQIKLLTGTHHISNFYVEMGHSSLRFLIFKRLFWPL